MEDSNLVECIVYIENARKRMQLRGQQPQPTRGKYRFNVEIKYGIEYTPADERTK